MTLAVDGKQADRFVQGTAMLDTLAPADAVALLDGVAELGGTTFDLAHAYGAGVSETRMGEWLQTGGTRDDVFLITKGGHPAEGRRRIARGDVRSDLETSLERLGTDRVDLYLLHRDDEQVPVDEIVAFMDELCREGTIRAYGGSNWRHERFDDARSYALRHDLTPPVASSPHFSLAIPVRPPWPGCVSIAGEDGADGRAYYRRHRIPVLAWSSLAMGFFAADAERGAPGQNAATVGREQAMSADVFGSARNDARRERARELAVAHGDTPTQIAFRYALSQPMDVRPIVGCRTVAEYAALRDASERRLTPSEVQWLEHGDEAPTDGRDGDGPD